MKQSRLVVGVDVPWVTAWTGEGLAGARPCVAASGRLAVHQQERPGIGRPLYAANHFRRQRETVASMLCPMCGQPTEPDDRWTLTAKPVAVGALRSRGLGHLVPPAMENGRVVINAGTIAPLHKACADRSSRECPHLRGDAHLALRRFPERRVVSPLWVEGRSTGPETALLAHVPAPTPIISFLQLLGVTEEVDAHWRQRPA